MQMNADDPSIAIAALSWIAADPAMMSRFSSVTGIEPEHIRAAAQEPGFLAGVLGFVLAHGPTLDRFCADNDLQPDQVAAAERALNGGAVPGPGDFI